MDDDRFLSRGHVVQAAWIDTYDHMNMARYVSLFDEVGYELLEQVGLGAPYSARTRHGLFIVDVRIRYLKELRAGMSVAIRLRLVGCDHVRLHMWLEMLLDGSDTVCATQEQIGLHASLDRRKTVPFADAQRASLQAVVALHRSEPDQPSRPLSMRCGR